MAGVGDSVLGFKVRMVLLAWHPVVLRSEGLYKELRLFGLDSGTGKCDASASSGHLCSLALSHEGTLTV